MEPVTFESALEKTPGERLRAIDDELTRGGSPESVSVRTFLSWFGAFRRGYWIVRRIRDALDAANLETQPDFESAWMDATISFSRRTQGPQLSEPQDAMVSSDGHIPIGSTSPTPPSSPTFQDPSYRISKLQAANKPVTDISPDSTLTEAITVMMANDFSQLPVMTTERDVKGMLTWQSIGARRGLGLPDGPVRDYMDPHQEILATDSLFNAIPVIVRHGSVLVRGDDRRIQGIITASDLSLQFLQMTEPFLQLSEIENHVRRIINGRITSAELGAFVDPADADRSVESVGDLSFGEYVRLFENETSWARLQLPIDRRVFVRDLETVRRIRNDVMHFDPDGVPPADLDTLRRFATFLQRLQTLGVT